VREGSLSASAAEIQQGDEGIEGLAGEDPDEETGVPARAAGVALAPMGGGGAGARGVARLVAAVGGADLADARSGPPPAGCGQRLTRPPTEPSHPHIHPGRRRAWRSVV